ncbi:MAG: trimethylamine methyltransferase [Mesorhizobium sp.]|uniref:trimethylamine methyltransferase family protein n=1 Tax=Mesorhizobium sp. TaxID=1871066 RepID=UPI000FE9ACC3|nr:trimethylamine methyltransferase family protein [Mesorhizobium sp.]RWL87110.1 MAG: trimethylamine methyltransferase [Mesorhizobium sp.]TJV67992.1 MAG: trimethylamine methyltransferase [Mesorhizobium sp.]
MTKRVQRSGQRPRREVGSAGVPSGKVAYRRLSNPLQPQRSFSDDQIATLHDTALRVLENLGMRVLNEEALAYFRKAGAKVDTSSSTVFIDRGLVRQALASAPASFALAGGSSDRDIQIGGSSTAFVCIGGPPNVMDIERGRRAGTQEDMRTFLKLTQHFEIVHLLSVNVEPQDVPLELRHLVQTEGQLTLSNKPLFVYARGSNQVRDMFEMIRLARGVDEEDFRARPYCFTVINTNSPRQLDVPMCQGIIDFARAKQVAIITPFTLAGAMAPITIAGALALQHAEALAGITLSQIVNPGAPVVYGSFTSNVDMKSGSPAFGTPEFVRAAFGAGQLARHIGLPWRGSAATASNTPDAQATYEYLNSVWGSVLGGVNMMLHAAGWLESGLSASLEKFILDVEMLQTIAEIFQTADLATDNLYEAIAEVEPGGHFFGAPYTMSRYQTAFYSPLVSDWRNFGQWSEDGSKTATMRANTIWKKVVEDFKAPSLQEGAEEALREFVARRTREGGAFPA